MGTAPYLRGQRVVVVASFADGPAEFVLPADAALAEGASLELANYPDAALPADPAFASTAAGVTILLR